MNLKDFKTVICVGSGGVGKTSVSASLAVVAAKMGLKTLVMTIDPSKRLKTSLGLQGTGGDIVEVTLADVDGKLFASVLDAEKIFTEFIFSSASTDEQAQRLLKNRLYQQLSTTLSGSQEFTSLLQLSKVVASRNYDLVILDTPPAQHAVDFLEAPQKLQNLFQESVVKWFVGEDKVGFIRKILAKSTRIVLSALEKITGSQFMLELSDFFESIQGLQLTINEKTSQVQSLLVSDQTAFVLVTSLDEVKLKEARDMRSYLESRNYCLQLNIVNRAFPNWFIDYKMQGLTAPPLDHLPDHLIAKWVAYYEQKNSLFHNIFKEDNKKHKSMMLADHSIDMSGIKSIEVLADEIKKQL